jgi:hypothetical protein
LHENGYVHGDIRLANLLSTGFIIDFDFVGLDTYPNGLNPLHKEKVRHPEVAEAIKKGNIGMVKPQKKHDCYSMEQVLHLFQPQPDWWESATKYVAGGDLGNAIRLLREHEEDLVSLSTISIDADATAPSE